MQRSDLYFSLPTNLIAQKLSRNPANARLLILLRKENACLHARFEDLLNYLDSGDILVFNNSRVIPTRVWGCLDSGGQVEVTLVSKLKENLWEALVRPDYGVERERSIYFTPAPLHSKMQGCPLKAHLVAQTAYQGWILRFSHNHGKLEDILEKFAEVNLPFYIKSKVKLQDYQNVYAKIAGSTQCPTAGLHFTRNLLDKFRRKGIGIVYITLHVGGSVLPLNVKDFSRLKIHKEYFRISDAVKNRINQARRQGKRLIAVGTTVIRALEARATPEGQVKSGCGWTDLTIKTGYNFKVTDGIVTNFHLPGSSHLLLTSAFAGADRVLSAYRQAVKKKYKFLDFGDAMFIL
ncbi:MAG: tRNA preQ1(34) S-adenosylmethionine ribosyltransferase-isomerase QueA [Candidatus Omnitrophota bacterium]